MFKIIAILLAVVVLTAVALCLARRRSALPFHLTPYFKDSAQLDAFVQKQRADNARRREELANPANAEEAAEYLARNGYDGANSTLEKALQMVEANLKDNPCDYGQLLGEMYAFSKAYRNPEKAYYYYFVGLSQDGYSVGFRDENHDPPYYCGPIGDFRNESQVSELVEVLGWDKTEQIDLKAREWLALNNLEVKEFMESHQDPTMN